jgi:transcriptional regulator with XRE-family HTH domain
MRTTAARGSQTPDRAEGELSRARVIRRGPGRNVRLTLRAMRESSGKTQEQVAKKSGLAQPEISKLETAATLDDRMVATLRRYLSAIGDELELVAVSKFGHRIGVAGASGGETSTDSPSTLARLREHIAAARNVIGDAEPVQPGININIDRWGGVAERTLEAIFVAAGVRWGEEMRPGAAPKRYYELPQALLRQAADAFDNEANQSGGSLAKDIGTMLQALTAAWQRGDTKALRSPSALGMRDAPTRWAAKYTGERPASRTEQKHALVAHLERMFSADPKSRTVKNVIYLALQWDCIKDEHHGWPLELQSKLEKDVQKNGWPHDVTELVERLLRLAGERDPLNTIRKRQRRKDRTAV